MRRWNHAPLVHELDWFADGYFREDGYEVRAELAELRAEIRQRLELVGFLAGELVPIANVTHEPPGQGRRRGFR